MVAGQPDSFLMTVHTAVSSILIQCHSFIFCRVPTNSVPSCPYGVLSHTCTSIFLTVICSFLQLLTDMVKEIFCSVLSKAGDQMCRSITWC